MTDDVRETARELLTDLHAGRLPPALRYDPWLLSKIVGEVAGTVNRKVPRGFTEHPRDDVRAWMLAHPLASRHAIVL